MKKGSEKMDFGKARGDTVENLRAIRAALARCIEEGMLDVESSYYNQILSFIDQANLSRNWAELGEVINQAKILEIDIAAWLSGHGRTSFSLPWPRPPSSPQGK